MLLALLCFLLGGAIAGIFAGLLGVGGGIIIVPLLSFLFPLLSISPEHAYHLALGTSLASIMVTSVASSRAHHKRGAVRWEIFRAISPGILLGTFMGGIMASHIPNAYLKAFFVAFLYFIAFDMIFGKKKTEKKITSSPEALENISKTEPESNGQLPGKLVISAIGTTIGLISSFVGIGGGTMSVPFMLYYQVPIRIAVGTSAAIGFPIALAGTLGYIVGGYDVAGLPEFTLGYVHILAFVGLASASYFTAPYGAALAHKLPVQTLKRFFAIFLICVASRMLWNLI